MPRVKKRFAIPIGIIIAVILLRLISGREININIGSPDPDEEKYEGASFTSWDNVASIIERLVGESARDEAISQLTALGATRGNNPDFGYVMWNEGYVNAVTVKGDWVTDFLVDEDIFLGAITQKASRLVTCEISESDDSTRVDARTNGWGWWWQANDPDGRDALRRFANRLKEKMPQN